MLTEFPNADAKTIEDKLLEVWQKVPVKYQAKYYAKAHEICQEFKNYIRGSSNKLKTPIKENFTTRRLLKPKALKFDYIPNQLIEGGNSNHSDDNEMFDHEKTATFNYSNLKETMTYNFADKSMKKQITKKKCNENDSFVENASAVGYLQDILLSQQINTKVLNKKYKDDNYECILNNLDIHQLDSYLTGDHSMFDELNCYLPDDDSIFEASGLLASTNEVENILKKRSQGMRKRKTHERAREHGEATCNKIPQTEISMQGLQDACYDEQQPEDSKRTTNKNEMCEVNEISDSLKKNVNKKPVKHGLKKRMRNFVKRKIMRKK